MIPLPLLSALRVLWPAGAPVLGGSEISSRKRDKKIFAARIFRFCALRFFWRFGANRSLRAEIHAAGGETASAEEATARDDARPRRYRIASP